MRYRLGFWVGLVASVCVASGSVAFEIVPQLGHTNQIKAVAYSPDGRYVASASDDKTLKLWEVATGKELRTFKGHDDEINDVAFSPDGAQILSAGGYYSKTLKLWEVSSGKLLRTFEGHTHSVNMVAFIPGGRAVSGSGDGTVRVWELSTGKELRSLVGYKDGLTASAVSPDGKYVAAANTNHVIKLWEVSTGKELHSLRGHSDQISAVAFSPDGRLLVSGSKDKKITLWEVATGKELIRPFTKHSEAINAVTFSPDGKRIASGGLDNLITLREVATGKELGSLQGHRQWVRDIAFNQDGSLLLSGSDDRSMRLWEVSTGRELQRFSGRSQLLAAVAMSANGRYAISQDIFSNSRLWDLSTGKEQSAFTLGSTTVSFSADGKLFLGGKDSTLFDSTAGKELRDLAGKDDWVYSVGLSADGTQALWGEGSGKIKLIEVATGAVIRTFTGHKKAVVSVVFSGDGAVALSASKDNTVKIWDVATGNALQTISGQENTNKSAALSADGKYFISRSGASNSALWEVATGKQVRSFYGLAGWTDSVALSADGKVALSGDIYGEIKLWSTSTGETIRKMRGHTDWSTSVALSADGEYALSGSYDTTMRLWRLDTGDSMVMISGQKGEWLLYTDDGYFDASPSGTSLVAVVEGMHAFQIDQLALKYNRPDLILKRMGLGTPELIEYYRKRYLNRLKKAGLDESKLDGSFTKLPQSTIRESRASGQEATLSITLQDKVGLASYQVYVNGVPLYEGYGKETAGTSQTVSLSLPLLVGDNRVEVSALNTRGQESLRAFALLKGPEEMGKDLYFVGFGVSDYADEDIPDLQFAHKDAKELSDAFGALNGFENKHIKVFSDAEVTRESFQEAIAFLKKTRPQDVVVLFIAGHGLYDRDDLATYYYVIHSTQIDLNKDGSFKLDTSTAVSFSEIEGLLSGIDARQKLFLMDTCESGERDEGDAALTLADAASRSLDARAIGVSKVKTAPKKTAKKPTKKSTARPWLLERERYIYQDLSRRTGAVVFSSSKGGEFSYEDPKLENGLFTEALLGALGATGADTNKDGLLSIEELRVYVMKTVASSSKELQHPTIDRDNPYINLFLSQ